ncbi:MAG: prepilin-type N-terminal cleavage/methylation domain-containing protein [Euzebyales bacterium]|nr:prepilin-type N-terminal cleavage/methylation domain-containing protein [Euzebyales bacterium]
MPVTGPRWNGEEGVSLVEVLVVIVLLAMVGAVAMSGLVTGLRASAKGQDRITALTDMQKGVEAGLAPLAVEPAV